MGKLEAGKLGSWEAERRKGLEAGRLGSWEGESKRGSKLKAEGSKGKARELKDEQGTGLRAQGARSKEKTLCLGELCEKKTYLSQRPQRSRRKD